MCMIVLYTVGVCKIVLIVVVIMQSKTMCIVHKHQYNYKLLRLQVIKVILIKLISVSLKFQLNLIIICIQFRKNGRDSAKKKKKNVMRNCLILAFLLCTILVKITFDLLNQLLRNESILNCSYSINKLQKVTET